MNVLVIVDMQNDFISGSLGSPEAEAVVGPVCRLAAGFDGQIVFTRDTHDKDYLNTQEGKYLPVEHCIKPEHGWQICDELAPLAQKAVIIDKISFGSFDALPQKLKEMNVSEIHFAGLCTDICVISNAMICKAAFPEIPIYIHSTCCAGVSEESHKTALDAMAACQIIIE